MNGTDRRASSATTTMSQWSSKVRPMPTARPRTDPFQILAEASDVAANHALDLEHLLRALEGLIRKVVSYQLFAVLLADDDAATRWALTRSLQQADPEIRVDEAETGSQALQAMRDDAAGTTRLGYNALTPGPTLRFRRR